MSSFSFAAVFTSDDTFHWMWYSNDCDIAESNHINVTPTAIPITWEANTVYDFGAGTYDLTSSIIINQSCIALIWNDNVVINGNWTNIINISSNYNIIKNIKINGNAADAINIWNSSNSIINTSIFNSNRWIYLNSSNNNIIKEIKLFNNNVWIYFENNSSENILNNIITFNNNQHWFYINWGSKNIINNSFSFNNTQDWINISVWTQNTLNNSITYNNSQRWIRILIAWNYVNNIKTFNNGMNNTIIWSNTWYGLMNANVTLPAALKLWLSTDPLLWTIWRTNWSVNTTLIPDSTQIFNPHDWTNFLIDTTTATGTRRWVKAFWNTFVVSSSSWWANVPNQIQPVQRNSAWTQLENNSLSFSASKKIWEVVVASSSPSWWAPSQPICGNKLVESGEECDDGNKRNGDWCNFSCKKEQPWICGNGKLEYMEECDDGNTKDWDSCSSLCTIEWANLILSPKLLLQQKALEKTLGIPAALIDLKEIKTTSDFILSTINQNQKQQVEQCQYTDTDYSKISFDDATSIYQKQIETLLNYCIVQGKQIWNQRTFGTKDYTTYAEFIKVLIKAHFLWTSVDFHNNTFDIQKVYTDVAKNTWYAPYIIKAYVHDILIPIEKIVNNAIYISPETNITRLDAIRLLIHSLKLANKNPKNIEIITDTFQDANKILTREEMAALIVYWYELDYDSSLRMRSNNGILMKLLAEHIKKYTQEEQIDILKNMIGKIEKINESTLRKVNIHKKQLLADVSILIDFSEVFLK